MSNLNRMNKTQRSVSLASQGRARERAQQYWFEMFSYWIDKEKHPLRGAVSESNRLTFILQPEGTLLHVKGFSKTMAVLFSETLNHEIGL